jgi:hypothetical protein
MDHECTFIDPEAGLEKGISLPAWPAFGLMQRSIPPLVW